eukprot:scaffold24536_cov22-Tisochrysis_lutea.AAC.1
MDHSLHAKCSTESTDDSFLGCPAYRPSPFHACQVPECQINTSEHRSAGCSPTTENTGQDGPKKGRLGNGDGNVPTNEQTGHDGPGIGHWAVVVGKQLSTQGRADHK